MFSWVTMYALRSNRIVAFVADDCRYRYWALFLFGSVKTHYSVWLFYSIWRIFWNSELFRNLPNIEFIKCIWNSYSLNSRNSAIFSKKFRFDFDVAFDGTLHFYSLLTMRAVWNGVRIWKLNYVELVKCIQFCLLLNHKIACNWLSFIIPGKAHISACSWRFGSGLELVWNIKKLWILLRVICKA